jgi:hypothetical protein
LKLLAIVPGKEFPADDKSKALRKAVFEESPKGSKGCLLVSILLFLAGAIGVWTTFRDQGKDISGIASMVAIVGISLILVNVYQFLVAKKIQMAQTWIESKTVSPGNRVPCGLVFQVNRPVEVQCASATVIGKEVVVRKSGYTRSGQNISHTLCEKKHELKLPVKNVPARVPIRVQGEVSVPEDAPFSFDLVKEFGGGIKLSWNVEFRIEMKNWPDWFYRQEITVLPGNSI